MYGWGQSAVNVAAARARIAYIPLGGGGPLSRQTRALTPRRVCFLAFEALLAAVLVALNVDWSFPNSTYLSDFGSFVASGTAAAAGLDPYAIYPTTAHGLFAGTVYASPNLNPPISVLAFLPLAHVDPYWAFRAWYVLSVALYLVALALLLRAYPTARTSLHLIWAFNLAGLWHTLLLGQVYVPLALAVVGACLLVENGRPLPAGLLMGAVVAFKPNFAIWPLLLAVAGNWVCALAALGAAGALSLLPVAVFGPRIYTQWLAAAANPGLLTMLPGNNSLQGVAARLGIASLGVPLAAVLVVAVAALACFRRPAPGSASGLGLVASLLASPVSWAGYTLLLLPVLIGRRWAGPLRVGALLLLCPLAIVWYLSLGSRWLLAGVGSLYALALLLILAGLAREFRPCSQT